MELIKLEQKLVLDLDLLLDKEEDLKMKVMLGKEPKHTGALKQCRFEMERVWKELKQCRSQMQNKLLFS